MTELLDSPQAIVLGGGLRVSPESQTVLSPCSQNRINRAIELYQANPGAFHRAGSIIVCTGNATPLSDTEYSRSEASLMADALMAAEVPHSLIEAEGDSSNTLTNFLNSADVLAERAKEFNGETEPLLSVVTQPWHYHPRAQFLGSKCLGRSLQNAAAAGEASTRRRAQEFALYAMYSSLFTGIEDGDREAIRSRYAVVGKFINTFRSQLGRIWQ